ncbi:MAG: MG2 domain-containing protein, partial [Planctomycetota bacterium]
VVLALCSLVWAGEAESRQQIYAQIAVGEYEPARASIRAYLAAHPDSRHVPAVRLAFALTHQATHERAERVRLLRELEKEFSEETWVGRRVRRFLKEMRDWTPRPSNFPDRVEPKLGFRVEQDDQGTSRVSISFVEPVKARKYLLAVPFDKLDMHHLEVLKGVPRQDYGKFELDFRGGFDYLSADLKRPGLYLIEENRAGVIHHHQLWVTGKPYYAKALGAEAILFARGKCAFTLRTASGGVQELETDTTGFARFPVTEETLVLIREEWFVITPNSDKHERVLISTDRPIYRPGQTVRFKAVKRDLVLGSMRLPDEKTVQLEVRDPRGRVLQKKEYTFSESGSVVGEFRLADEPSMGRYAIFADVERPPGADDDWWWVEEELSGRWYHNFEVSAYRKPEMSVRIEFLERKKRTIRARVKAEYLFGGPVSKAEVFFTATAEPYWEDDEPLVSAPLPDPDGWWVKALDTETDRGWWGEPVAEGFVDIQEDGTAEIEIEVGDGWEPDRLRVTATVTDASNRAASGSTWMPGFAGSMRLEVGCDRRWYEVGDDVVVTVHARKSDGTPVPGAKVAVSGLVDFDDEGYESVFAGDVVTGPDGRASFKVAVNKAGPFRVLARAKGAVTARREYTIIDVDAPDSGG